MHQREAKAVPEIGTDLLVEFVILQQPIQVLEHRVDALGHARHPRKHILGFVAVNQHRVSLLCAKSIYWVPSCFPRCLSASSFTGPLHRRECQAFVWQNAGAGSGTAEVHGPSSPDARQPMRPLLAWLKMALLCSVSFDKGRLASRASLRPPFRTAN